MAEPAKPNILVIWGDDIGITNLSCYSDGLMGYRTPNIDRIADEGMRFTDSYGEQCGSTPPTCTCAPTPNPKASAKLDAGRSPYHDTMIDHDKVVGAYAGQA